MPLFGLNIFNHRSAKAETPNGATIPPHDGGLGAARASSGKWCCSVVASRMLANVSTAVSGAGEEGEEWCGEEEEEEEEEWCEEDLEEMEALSLPFGCETEGEWFGVKTGMFIPAFAFHGLLPERLDFSPLPFVSPNFPLLHHIHIHITSHHFHLELVSSASIEPKCLPLLIIPLRSSRSHSHLLNASIISSIYLPTRGFDFIATNH
jgi:hypothetical protein